MAQFTRIKTENSPRSIIRLPRLGKIRLGIKKTSQGGKEYPAEVDYFVVPDEVKQQFGDKPKSLPVMIAVEDEDKFLRQYYACYGSNQKIKCQGDGELAARRDDKGKITEMVCPSPESCDFGKQFKCHARIDIMLVLPDVNMGGCYQLSSGSVNTDIDLRSGLEMARYLFGRIAWVPMTLKREERKIPDPETGKMQTHWPVSLYPLATVAEVNQIRQDSGRILERSAQFSLPEPVIEGEFTRETEAEVGGSQEQGGVATLIEMIAQAGSEQEVEKLFKSNFEAINSLPHNDRVAIIAAKSKREGELERAA